MAERRALLALTATLPHAACDGPRPPLPPDPPGVVQPEEYRFGDVTARRDQRALFTLLDQLEPRFGRVDQGRLRVLLRELAPDADAEAVRRHYAAALAPLGLHPLPVSARPGSWAAAWTGRGAVFAVQALEPDRPGGSVPLNIVTNLPVLQPP